MKPNIIALFVFFIIATILVLLFKFLEGDARNSGRLSEIELKTSSEGIKYKVVEIEGKRFIATQGSNNYWSLAGPID